MKLKFTVLISLFVLLICTVSANAQNKCGDNAYWTKNKTTLTISGSGEMYDYEKSSPPEWKEFSKEITELKFSSDITKIGAWSFEGFSRLSKISFGEKLTQIGERAFYNCSALERLTFPKKLSKIGDGAFNSCTSVKRIDMPDFLAEIGTSAFMNLPQLASVKIPKTVNTIGSWAFWGNTDLRQIYFEGNPPENVGENIIPEPDKTFQIFCHYSVGEAWVKCDLFPLDNMYTYDPEKLIGVYINNREIVFDQRPVIVNSRTLVPVRAILEAMDAKVEWEAASGTVIATKGNTEIRLIIDENIMYKNGSPIALDCPAQIVNNRTLVPIRAISEAFEAEVLWNDKQRCVEIFINN